MARFTHPAVVRSGSSDNNTWQVMGGTLGSAQPTFSGTPLFSGSYSVMDHLCNFAIDVTMTNILTFGDGQYYMQLPEPSKHNIVISGGCLHDTSTNKQYFIMGDVDAGSDIIRLTTVTSNGLQVPFSDSDGVPIKLATADTFHIAGSYITV